MPPRERLILEALRTRAEEVRGLLQPGAEAAHHPPAEDPEEALRIVMVRLWPALPEGRDDLVAALHTLEEAARSEDLRFLDAWNNAYESLERTAPQSLLATYAELLDHHIQRLAG